MPGFHRSHNCGDLKEKNIGAEVSLCGWVHRRRDHGGLIFIDMRDRFGLTQLVFNPTVNPVAHQAAEKLRAEWVIQIHGTVLPRGEGMTNPKLPTGAIEVQVDTLEVLSKAKTPPFSICDESIDVHEELRLTYRYLDIRRGDIAEKLLCRHKAMQLIRRYLDSNNFLEISTPILGKSTPEGARDYLVPSRVHPGSFYALPQSPQLFKQLLMVAGMDRYFQIATCFRDEDLRADRQPEFTQVDIEMSFATPDDLMPLIEGVLCQLFKECKGVELATPFRRMPHATCMERYGCDRPDLRFGMPLHTIDSIASRSSFSVFLEQIANGGTVKGFCVKGGADISRKGIDEYTTFLGHLGIKGLAWMKFQEGALSSSIVKFFSEEQQNELIALMGVEEGDLLFFVADMPAKANQGLDHLRRKVARDRNMMDPNRYEMVWVTDFPLFSWNDEEGRLDSEHHPFTSPLSCDIHLLESEPLKVRSSGYDIVLNGSEIGGGSQRIHDMALQQKIFELLKLTPEELQNKFGFFLEALSYGTPPHLGIALGLDRLIMILTQTENIRDVIAFPKTQKAGDLMMDSPSKVTRQQLNDVKLRVAE